ncbi:tropomyosin-2-like [Camellia sinensis]|uniref:tropomyosin-2-like n=1 Tax=Camellia sinensis TaxID=4442 RepID=UPI001035C0A0|nr:tropomyosin-2-like [Camellia sinensis]
MLDGRPLTVGDSAANLEIEAALSTAVLLPEDMNCMAELHEYEDFAFLMQHSVLAIQHAHSYATKTEMMRKDLAKKTKEAAKLLSSLNKAKASNRALMDQAKDAKTAQSLAEEKAKEAKNEAEAARADLEAANAKVADMEAKLQEALANKEAEVKAADEKAFEEGQATVHDQYKQQVNLACNRGYYLEPEKDVEDDEVDEVDVEAAADAKSPTLNEQIDLTQEEKDDLASKGVSPIPTTSETEIYCAEKSLDKTLQEIDAELEAERTTTLPSDQAKSST